MQTITEAALDIVADAINRASYHGSTQPVKGLAEENRSSQEYARRLARAAMVAMQELTD